MQTPPNPDSQQLLALIRKGDPLTLERLYRQNRTRFLRWAYVHYTCTDDEAAEVYQKSFSILYYNVRDGKLTALSSSLETYLLGIGKRVFLELFRQKRRQGAPLEEAEMVEAPDVPNYLRSQALDERQRLVDQLLERVGEACAKVLRLFYFSKYNMEDIAEEMGYSNDDVAKKKKYECLQKLRKMAAEMGLSASQALGD